MYTFLPFSREILEASEVPPGLSSEQGKFTQILNHWPAKLNFLTFLGSEHKNKIIKHDRQHHAVQTTLAANIKDVFNRSIHGADPETLYLIGELLNLELSKKLPLSIKDLIRNPEDYEFVEDSIFKINFDTSDAEEVEDDSNERELVIDDFMEVEDIVMEDVVMTESIEHDHGDYFLRGQN